MAHQCKVCFNDFAWDPSARDKSQLPVQSRVCSHVLCLQCVVSMYEASPACTFWDDSSTISSAATRDSVPCPECRQPGAYSPFDPVISLSMCDLLAERHAMMKYMPDGVVPTSSGNNQMTDKIYALAKASRDSVERTWAWVSSEYERQKPFLPVRVTKDASRVIYWGSLLVFGSIQCGGRPTDH